MIGGFETSESLAGNSARHTELFPTVLPFPFRLAQHVRRVIGTAAFKGNDTVVNGIAADHFTLDPSLFAAIRRRHYKRWLRWLRWIAKFRS